MKTFETFYKNTYLTKVVVVLLLVAGNLSCGKDDGPEPVPIVESTPKEEIKLSDAKQITSFVFLLTNNPIDINVVATIDEVNKTITAAIPPNTDLSGLLPEVKITEQASIDIDTAQDFTEPVEYTVTAEDGSTAVYTVTVSALLTQRQILQAILDANPGNLLGWDLQNTADLGDLDRVTTNTEGQIIELLLQDKELILIPSEIGQLKNLIILHLFQNKITSIPKEIGKLSSLSTLSLFTNELTSIPSEIGQLTNLTSLTLSNNKLTSIPSELEQLTNLERLVISTNQFTSLPLEVGKFTKLTVLGLGGMQLTSLPSEIGQLTNLTRLSLSGNQLTSLPLEIGQLTNLTYLSLSGNQLTSLPLEIVQLTNLEDLFLSNNQFTSIPPEIGQLTSLTNLTLRNNQLTSIPPEIGFLTKLESLSMTDNNLNTIPQSIINLRLFNNPDMLLTFDTDMLIEASQKDALISIYSANPGNTLGWGVDNFPEVTFDENGNPKVITMNNKNLSRLPLNIAQLTGLESLNVNGNNLESLPGTMSNLSALNTITAANNNLTTVPSTFGSMSGLALLSLTQNPITSIPQEVCDLQISNGGILTILTDPGEGCD